jgi:hypothetical protein
MPDIKGHQNHGGPFSDEVDSRLDEDIELHCCGGFVTTQLYGVARTTSDVDFLRVVPNVIGRLMNIGGKGSVLHQKHKVYLDAVAVATPPESYEDRLVPMFPDTWHHLRLLALEAHDLALSKLERNIERDRSDVQQLALAGRLRADILKERYYAELRPNLLAHEPRHDLTLRLWLESYF